MPKKSKVNKLARMSDEERARYLQHRADMEEEARRRKRELIARFIKNKLDKEEAYARMNTAKINQQWRYILRNIKCQQMGTDIQGMMSSFNFMIERKDRLIQSLIRALEDSDDQHRRAFQAHTENVSYFISIGSQRLNKIQAQYEQLKNEYLENWEKEELDLVDSQERSEFKLILITYIQDRDFKADRKEKEMQRATVKNDLRLEHEEEMLSMCCPKRLEIENYWSQLQEVFASYLEQHNPIMAHYQSLRDKDEFYQRDIARNEKQIQQATEKLLTLQSEWQKISNLMSNKLSRMMTQKDDLTKKYWQMKKDLKTEQNKGNEKLTLMVNASQDAIKRLEEAKQKIDKIMQLADICRKYEHEGDDLQQQEQNDLDTFDFENLTGDMIEEWKGYSKMDAFMLKVNRARLQTICLKHEKSKLAKENNELKHCIRKYLTELALKGKERPMSMKIYTDLKKSGVNGKGLNRPVTCIEGALSNAVLHEKRMKALDKKNKDSELKAYPRVQCWMKAS